MVSKIRIGIVGGAGYTGGELIRLLLNHPAAELVFVHSKSQSGQALHAVHQDLLGETGLRFSSTTDGEIDLLFLCLGHGEARKFLTENQFPASVRIIDLSQDFRLTMQAQFEGRSFIYGFPELDRDAIRQASNIANPGCFATAIQLGLLPLAKAGLLNEVHTTGITGSTGAGQGLSPTSHFSWRANNIQAYKTLTHQHLGEIGESLGRLQGLDKIELNFIPWRGDFTRGIFISSQMKCVKDIEELNALYEEFYQAHPFVTISQEPVFLKQVVNTNKGVIQLEKVGDRLVVHSAIDNLLKGASGQAVQNMNLMFGLEETLGLKLKGSFF